MKDFLNLPVGMSEDALYLTVAGVLFVLGIAAWFITRPTKVPGEEKPMSRKEYEENRRKRKERIKSELADDIGDAILKRMVQKEGPWSNEEARLWHLRLGMEFGLKDLLPQRPLTMAEMKTCRLRKIEAERKLPSPKIPGTAPLKDNRNFKNPLDAIMAKHFKPATT